jgi:hypothetical protein
MRHRLPTCDGQTSGRSLAVTTMIEAAELEFDMYVNQSRSSSTGTLGVHTQAFATEQGESMLVPGLHDNLSGVWMDC